MFSEYKGVKEKAESINCADSKDFKKLYDATMELLFKVAYRIVNDEEAAEDLVHDSYIKVNEKQLVFPSLDDAKFWLIRVVKNASLNYAQRKAREARAYHKILYEGRQEMDSSETDVLRAEAMERTRAALDQLPPKLKEVLVLREYGDMNYREIGRVLGITEGNVKVRIFRAREQLLKLIGDEDVYLS